MSNKILCLLTATSLSLIALSAQAQTPDPSRKAGNQQNATMGGNDQNRRATEGISILGGGPRKVDPRSANARAFQYGAAGGNYGQSNYQKQEADRIYKDGIALARQNKLPQAEAAIKASLNIRETNFATSDPTIPEVKEKLAEIYGLQGKKKEALEMYSSAMTSYAKFNGPGTAHRIRPLTGMGTIHLGEQNYKGALDCYNQAYMLTLRAKGLGSPEAMRLRLQLAAVNQAAKSYDLAASLYNECFDLQKKNEKLIEKDQLVSSLKNYIFVLKELKRDDEATKLTARLNALTGATPVAATENEVLKPDADAKPATEVTTTTGTDAPTAPAK